jgi:Cu/Ag efflux pump CusA
MIMRWIVESSVKFRVVVIPIALALMVIGIIQARQAPTDVLPEFTPPYVEVQVESLGLSAEEMQQLVVVPLEADLLNGVPYLDEIFSQNVAGLSRIQLFFEPGTDILDARQVVTEALTGATGPPHTSRPPQVIQPQSSTNRVMMIGLRSDKLSLIDLSVLARWNIRPRLQGVEGVANVAVFGQRERQLQVQVDPQVLRDKNVSLEQIVRTTGNAQLVSPLGFLEASAPGTGGFIESASQRLGVRHVLPIGTPGELAKVPLDGRGDRKLALGDVAKVVEGHPLLIGDAAVKDSPGLVLVVEKFPGANTRQVTEDLESALDRLAPGLTGVEIDRHIYRPASFIDEATGNIWTAFIVGGALLLLALLAFYSGWRGLVISVSAMALSLAAAVLVLSAFGTTFNAMIVGGIALAALAIIADAVGDARNLAHRVRQERSRGTGRPVASTVVAASLEARRVAVYTTLIVLLALVPLLFTEDLAGALLPPTALAYGGALLASMLVALTVTPALGVVLFSKELQGEQPQGEQRESPLVGRLKRGYRGFFSRFVRTPRIVVGAVVLLVVAGVVLAPQVDESLLPGFKERDILVHWDGPPGTSRSEIARITNRASRELRSVPGVRNVGTHLGRAVAGDQTVSVNSGELWVSIDRDADYDKTLAAVQSVVDGYPGLRRDVRTYPEERTAEILKGPGNDLAVRVYGGDPAILRVQTQEVLQAVAKVDGVVNPRIAQPAEEPTLEVETNLAAAERHGIKPGDVRRAAATLLSGIEVGSLFEDQKVFEVTVWSEPQVRNSVSSVENLLIDTPRGGHVRLGEVADVRLTTNPTVVNRHAVSRYFDVVADVDGRGLDSVESDVRNGIEAIPFPLEYRAEVLGEQQERADTRNEVIAAAIAAAIGILFLLQAAFASWRLAAAFFLTVPLSLVGGLVAGFSADSTFSLGALMGFFGVGLIAIRNGIGLITHYQQLEHAEGVAFGPELVLRGTQERLAPIVTTAVAGAAVFLPFLVSGSIAGFEVIHPMAVVILGGLVTSTLVALLIVPALYLRFGAAQPTEAREDLLYRWAGIEPEAAATAPAGAEPVPAGGDGEAAAARERASGVGKEEGESESGEREPAV